MLTWCLHFLAAVVCRHCESLSCHGKPVFSGIETLFSACEGVLRAADKKQIKRKKEQKVSVNNLLPHHQATPKQKPPPAGVYASGSSIDRKPVARLIVRMLLEELKIFFVCLFVLDRPPVFLCFLLSLLLSNPLLHLNFLLVVVFFRHHPPALLLRTLLLHPLLLPLLSLSLLVHRCLCLRCPNREWWLQ